MMKARALLLSMLILCAASPAAFSQDAGGGLVVLKVSWDKERIRPRPSVSPLASQDELVQQSRRERDLAAARNAGDNGRANVIETQITRDNDAKAKAEVLAKRKALIDLLEEFPACTLPFEVYLEMLPALRPRYYSISSSPLSGERACSITVAVVDALARSGRGVFQGVCTNYLARQNEGDVIYAFVKDTKSAFRLPEDPMTPIVMIGPGTGPERFMR